MNRAVVPNANGHIYKLRVLQGDFDYINEILYIN